MTKDLIYEDDYGNRLIKDVDNRLVVLNKYNNMVSPNDVRNFISRLSVKMAMKQYFGEIPNLKILNSMQTQKIRKKIPGGIY
jgi:hypothetical protein